MLCKWASNASWPPIIPQLPLYGSNMHPSSGRNPWWFSRGLHLYHPGYRQINNNIIGLRSGADRRQNHNHACKHLFGRVSIASMLIHRSPTLSPALDMGTLRLVCSFSHALVCSLPTHLYLITCFEKINHY